MCSMHLIEVKRPNCLCFCEQITLNEDFDVSRSWCLCPRGEVVCHHIATVLLYAKENFSKTDAPCSWVRKKILKKVKTAAELYPSSKQSVLNREPDNSDRDWFQQALDTTDRYKSSLSLVYLLYVTVCMIQCYCQGVIALDPYEHP